MGRSSRRKSQPKPPTTQQQPNNLPGNLPPQQRVSALLSQSFSGPIPHPEIFRQYGEIIPNAPERILSVFEQDSTHAREIGMAALQAAKNDTRRSHWMAYSIILLCLGMIMALAYMGKDNLAGILAGVTLAGTITGAFQNRKKPTNGTKQ